MFYGKIKLLVLLFLLLLQHAAIGATIEFSDSLFNAVYNKYGEQARKRVNQWQQLISDYKNQSEQKKLKAVNDFFNKIAFVNDAKLWGKKDYWATPIEFIGINAGDCEDFTIAKYVTLLALGVDDSKLRFMYVTATRPRQAHMVLAYYAQTNDIPLVLDNIDKRILPASRRPDLLPVYSFNGKGLWRAKEQGRGKQMRSNNNNKLWHDLHTRMHMQNENLND